MTEMPVCTRLVVWPCKLATLKLPQVRELCLFIDAHDDHVWEKHIAVNANLSGLKLLHLRYDGDIWPTTAVIEILGSLPALETLITDMRCLHAMPDNSHVNFFEAFVPMNEPGPTALNQSSRKGQISGVLCPRLETWQIEGISPFQRAELMPVLKDIVTLRAVIGFPLKGFTIYAESYSETPQMWQLIGGDKSFMVEEVVPAKEFRLDI